MSASFQGADINLETGFVDYRGIVTAFKSPKTERFSLRVIENVAYSPYIKC